MTAPLFLLGILIWSTLAVLIDDGSVALAAVAMASAAVLVAVARAVRRGEGQFLALLSGPFAAVAGVPALVILLQVFPSNALRLSNPIWDNAEAVLGQPIKGSISIDPGATLLVLGKYLTLAVMTFIVMAVAIDRRRASSILPMLAGVSTVIAVAAVFDPSRLLGLDLSESLRAASIDITVLGAVVCAASALQAYRQAGRRGSKVPTWRLPLATSLWAAGCAVCCLAILRSGMPEAAWAAAGGLLCLAGALNARRLHLETWGQAALAGMLFFSITLTLFAVRPTQSSEVTLAFASQASRTVIRATEHAMTDLPWAGTGAGTSSSLLAIYREADEAIGPLEPPTAAAVLAIELGRPMLWAVLAATALIAIALIQGTLKRGRDYYYPATGAGALVSMLVLSFANAGVLKMGFLMVAAAILGLALAQRASPKAR